METLLLIAILFLLVVVAVELYLLRLDVRRLPWSGTPRAEEKAGQPTINVNVGLGSSAAVASPPPAEKAAAGETPAPAPAAIPDKDAPIFPRMPVTRISPSGVTILKCTGCGAENSSFRKECFKCGAKLS